MKKSSPFVYRSGAALRRLPIPYTGFLLLISSMLAAPAKKTEPLTVCIAFDELDPPHVSIQGRNNAGWIYGQENASSVYFGLRPAQDSGPMISVRVPGNDSVLNAAVVGKPVFNLVTPSSANGFTVLVEDGVFLGDQARPLALEPFPLRNTAIKYCFQVVYAGTNSDEKSALIELSSKGRTELSIRNMGAIFPLNLSPQVECSSESTTSPDNKK